MYKKSILNVLILISSLNFSLLFASEEVQPSPFTHFQTLNFQYENKETTFKSGRDGNILSWNSSLVDLEQRARHVEKFDVDQIHKVLREDEEKIRSGWKTATDNIVTAALTIILKKDQGYYALTCTLTKDVQEKGNKIKKTIAFVSGTVGRESQQHFIDASVYSLSQLFSNSLRRCKNEIFMNDLDLRNLISKVTDIQQSKKKQALAVMQEAKDVLEMEKLLGSFDTHPSVKDTDSTLKKSGGYGPIADSEQFLLHYLETELISKDQLLGTPKGIYINLISEFIEDQFVHLKKTFPVYDYKDIKKATENFDKGRKYAEQVGNYKPMGAILHLYSTRELCKFCATSIAEEFYHEKDNFVQRLKSIMQQEQGKEAGSEAFFVVLASFKDMVITEDPHPLRPKGTVSGKLVRAPKPEETKNGLINLTAITANKALPFLSQK